MIRLAISILALALSIPAQALNIDFYVTVAKEALDSGDYAKATEKCKRVFEEDPGNADCKSVMKKMADNRRKAAQARAAKQAEEAKAAENRRAQEKVANEKRKQLLASPEYNTKKACSCSAAEKFFESGIEEEQKVGAIGGVVDKVKLHQFASMVVMVQKVGSYYQSKAGSFDAEKCPSQKKSGGASVEECTSDAPQEAYQ